MSRRKRTWASFIELVLSVAVSLYVLEAACNRAKHQLRNDDRAAEEQVEDGNAPNSLVEPPTRYAPAGSR